MTVTIMRPNASNGWPVGTIRTFDNATEVALTSGVNPVAVYAATPNLLTFAIVAGVTAATIFTSNEPMEDFFLQQTSGATQWTWKNNLIHQQSCFGYMFWSSNNTADTSTISVKQMTPTEGQVVITISAAPVSSLQMALRLWLINSPPTFLM
jgi:hypothetical protein